MPTNAELQKQVAELTKLVNGLATTKSSEPKKLTKAALDKMEVGTIVEVAHVEEYENGTYINMKWVGTQNGRKKLKSRGVPKDVFLNKDNAKAIIEILAEAGYVSKV